MDAAIAWTSAGFVTSVASLILMLGVFMIALGATETDPSEGVFGYGLGVVLLAVWLGLVIIGGRILRKTGSRSRTILPVFVSILWCGLAAAMFTSALELTNALFTTVSSWVPSARTLVVFSVTTAGAIPIAAALLLTNLFLRIHRAGTRTRQRVNPSVRQGPSSGRFT